MDVVVDAIGEVEVNNIGHVGDVEAAAGDVCRHHDRSVAALEGPEGVFTLSLGLVTVDGAGGEPLGAQDVLDVVAGALGFNEDENESLLDGQEEAHKGLELVAVLNVLNGLGNVLAGRADATYCEENIVPHEIACEALDVVGEGRGEHHGLAFVTVGHALLLDDTADLGFKAHVQHAIRLIKNEELDALHGNAATFDEVDETAWSGDEEVAAALHLAKLVSDIGASVDDDGRDAGAVGEAAGFLVDLTC